MHERARCSCSGLLDQATAALHLTRVSLHHGTGSLRAVLHKHVHIAAWLDIDCSEGDNGLATLEVTCKWMDGMMLEQTSIRGCRSGALGWCMSALPGCRRATHTRGVRLQVDKGERLCSSR